MTNATPGTSNEILELILRLRLVIARLGEVELNAWWGTQDVLGSTGEMVFKRGFSRTHGWARAQVVFQMARRRCADHFPDSRAVTLWQLPAEVEDAFDQAWNRWIEASEVWAPFFQRLQEWKSPEVIEAFQHFELASPALISQAAGIAVSGPSVEIPGKELSSETLTLLALGFAKGSRGKLVVPYLHVGIA